MSSKKNNNHDDKDVIVSSVIEKTKKNNNLVAILLIIIVVLIAILIYLQFLKEDIKEKDCSSITIKEVEVEPKHQYINYQGFKFRMPLDWDFVSKDNEYKISNKDETLFMTLESIDVSYDIFITSTYQNTFLEELQTSGDIKIESSSVKEKDKKDYYLMEGTYNSYKYMITVIGNDEKVILIKTQFVDNVAFDKMKGNVVDFTVSSLKIS